MSITKTRRDAKANLEKKKLLAPEELEKKKQLRKKKIITIIVLTVLMVVAAAIISFNVVRAVGKSNLKKAVEISEPTMFPQTEEITEEEKEYWDPKWVKYNGEAYEYNDDILTFLVMGIDKYEEAKEVAEGPNGGQADALFLVVLDGSSEEIKIITINRNTMADVDRYNEEGAYKDTIKTQICLQHAFGNGMEESCERQVEAVSRLMYGIPINGYAAINRSAIPVINDAVGGVTLIALEDIDGFVSGTEYTLDGESALIYVWDRKDDIGAADKRLDRQKQYITGFISRAKEQAKSNPGSILELYNAIMSQMVTNITADEVMYLASEVSGYNFAADYITGLQGETLQGEEGFDEFYYDDAALYNLIINTFYRKVEQ